MSFCISKSGLGLATIFLIGLCITSTIARSADEPVDTLLSFLVGDYAVVGQEPGGGGAYSGSAHIEPAEQGLTLKRRLGEHEITAAGRFEVPSPPGEGRALRFHWQDPDRMLMTCLISSDLDNYPRLTCVWFREGSPSKLPGLEAMFPTAGWQSFQH